MKKMNKLFCFVFSLLFLKIFSLEVTKTYIFRPTTTTNLVEIIEGGFGIEKGAQLKVNITLFDHDIQNPKILFLIIPENQYVIFILLLIFRD
jgi:hypothetical protein